MKQLPLTSRTPTPVPRPSRLAHGLAARFSAPWQAAGVCNGCARRGSPDGSTSQHPAGMQAVGVAATTTLFIAFPAGFMLTFGALVVFLYFYTRISAVYEAFKIEGDESPPVC